MANKWWVLEVFWGRKKKEENSDELLRLPRFERAGHKRRSPRKSVRFPVLIAPIEVQNKAQAKLLLNSHTVRDMSLHGMRIETFFPFVLKDIIAVEFSLGLLGRKLKAKCEVVRSTYKQASMGGYYQVGLKFTEMSSRDAKYLETMLHRTA